MIFFCYRSRYGFKITDINVKDKRKKKQWQNKTNIIRYVGTVLSPRSKKSKPGYNQNIILFQSSSSPRRVAVPVLVKDGKPCSGGSNNNTVNNNQQSSSSSVGDLLSGGGRGGNNNNGTHNSTSTLNGSINSSICGSSGGSGLVGSSSVGGGVGGGGVGGTGVVPGSHLHALQQHQQAAAVSSQTAAQCMANGTIAMAAYRNQNNYLQHQQQCGAYLPLQGRAW